MLFAAVGLADPDPRLLPGKELSAAEQRDRRRLPIILKLCRDTARSEDWETQIRRYADQHGLSAYGRSTLTMNCQLYRHGLQDAPRRER